MAGRTLVDLVQKLGEGILADLLPIFENGLDSDNPDIREGVCLGMCEIMASAGKNLLVDFLSSCVTLIRKGWDVFFMILGLIDKERYVREAAAHAFDGLHQHLGSRAVDEILPQLLASLESAKDESSHSVALEALKEIMTVRSNIVFPVLLPTLLTTPMTRFNANALASIVKVAGYALTRRLDVILETLLPALNQTDEAIDSIKDAVESLMQSITGVEGVHQLMSYLGDAMKGNDQSRQNALVIFPFYL